MTEIELVKSNSWYQTMYEEKCKECGKSYVIYTQSDNKPEYHTEVYVKCECEEMVEFVLPVN